MNTPANPLDLNKVVKVIIVRKDLGMGKGKMVAQGGHAIEAHSLKLWKAGVPFDSLNEEQKAYYGVKFTKIALWAKDEAHLLDLYNQALAAGLDVSLIEDEGLTAFNGVHTKTCICIGPHAQAKVKTITTGLQLM